MDATTPSDLLIVDALFDSLTAWDDDLDVVPAAALRWDSDPSLRRWRFELADDGVFHDGSGVTADAFVAAWNAMAARGLAHHHLRDVAGYEAVRSGDSSALSGLRAVDGHTLEVRLSRPVADFPAIAAHPALAPVPPGPAADEQGRDEPVGNGPFRMGEPWARDRFVRLRRVAPEPVDARLPGRWIDEIVFRIQDQISRYIAYEQGRVDVADIPPGATAHRHRPRPRSTRYSGPGVVRGQLPTTYYLWFDTRQPPFDDVEVRRAVSMALDRGRIVREAFDGNASVAWSAVPSIVPGGRLRTCPACRHDPTDATTALRRAGVRRLALWISEDGDHERVAERVRLDLAAVGVHVDVRSLPFDRFQRRLRRGAAGLFRFGWTLDYPTMENGLRPLFHSTSTPQEGGANYGRYTDVAVDRLLDAAASTADAAARRELLQRAEDLVIGRDHAIVPIAAPRRTTVVAPRVRGLTYGPLGTANLDRVRLLDRRDDG